MELENKIPFSFDIYQYRMFNGYTAIYPHTKYFGDVLCLGTCDLTTMHPNDIPEWTWGQRLEKFIDVDFISRQYSCEFFYFLLVDYLKKHIPKKVCMVVPIYAEMIVTTNCLFGIHDNSRRVLRYLRASNIISHDDFDRLDNVALCVINKSHNTKVTEVSFWLNKIKTLLQSQNIDFYWTFNGTKTANKFYQGQESNFNLDSTYVGWIENLDILPENSIGEQTQISIFSHFKNRLGI